MLHRQIAIVSILGSTLAGLAVINAADFPPNPVEKSGWVNVVNEEFDDPSIDTTFWIPEYNALYSSATRPDSPRRRVPHEFKNDRGASVIRMYITTDTANESGNQGIQTFNQPQWSKSHPRYSPYLDKYTQLFGYYEERSMHPVGSTARHAAWWIMHARRFGSEKEIDVYEDDSYGGPNWHGIPYDSCKPCSGYRLGAETQQNYHIYGMELSPDGVRFYFDNQRAGPRTKLWRLQNAKWRLEDTNRPAACLLPRAVSAPAGTSICPKGQGR